MSANLISQDSQHSRQLGPVFAHSVHVAPTARRACMLPWSHHITTCHYKEVHCPCFLHILSCHSREGPSLSHSDSSCWYCTPLNWKQNKPHILLPLRLQRRIRLTHQLEEATEKCRKVSSKATAQLLKQKVPKETATTDWKTATASKRKDTHCTETRVFWDPGSLHVLHCGIHMGFMCQTGKFLVAVFTDLPLHPVRPRAPNRGHMRRHGLSTLPFPSLLQITLGKDPKQRRRRAGSEIPTRTTQNSYYTKVNKLSSRVMIPIGIPP